MSCLQKPLFHCPITHNMTSLLVRQSSSILFTMTSTLHPTSMFINTVLNCIVLVRSELCYCAYNHPAHHAPLHFNRRPAIYYHSNHYDESQRTKLLTLFYCASLRARPRAYFHRVHGMLRSSRLIVIFLCKFSDSKQYSFVLSSYSLGKFRSLNTFRKF